MDIAISIIAHVLPSLVLLAILFMGFKLASERLPVTNDYTHINQVLMQISNKLLGCIYVMGSLIALTIIWF